MGQHLALLRGHSGMGAQAQNVLMGGLPMGEMSLYDEHPNANGHATPMPIGTMHQYGQTLIPPTQGLCKGCQVVRLACWSPI